MTAPVAPDMPETLDRRQGPFGPVSAAALADPRTYLLHTDLVQYATESDNLYDPLCLDIDIGPSSETGPCARCHQPTCRYGVGGNPLCKPCQQARQEQLARP
ncbi:hypothetical protein AB0F11_24990 [Streptomyces sp. NPDC032472]|uniref:hypothetical protein n=1 Tax=Streptomyces sp. NPDC032472 TaxID=3155018 RepID=UPI0033EF70F3